MNLPALLQSALSPRPNRSHVSELAEMFHRIAAGYLRTKSAAGTLNLKTLGLPLEDVAWDCVADLFRRDSAGAFTQLVEYFQPINIDCTSEGDPYGGNIVNIDMRAQTELEVPIGLTELWIERSEELCRTIVTHGGWNMISLPIRLPSNYYLDLLPDAVSHPFRYTPGGYIVDDSLDPGVGYWIKFDGVYNYNICGWSVVDTCVDAVARWNMIGSFEDTVKTYPFLGVFVVFFRQ